MASPDKPRTDLPTIEGDSEPFWTALRDDGVFSIVSCNNCGAVHHYPRPFCPVCWSDDVELVAASGKATLYTYSTVYMNDLSPFKDDLPYVAAVVELAEGPRVMTTLVDCDAADIKIGMPVRMVPKQLTDDVVVAVFAPA
jgi:uncharacterized OB-fold protein